MLSVTLPPPEISALAISKNIAAAHRLSQLKSIEKWIENRELEYGESVWWPHGFKLILLLEKKRKDVEDVDRLMKEIGIVNSF